MQSPCFNMKTRRSSTRRNRKKPEPNYQPTQGYLTSEAAKEGVFSFLKMSDHGSVLVCMHVCMHVSVKIKLCSKK